MPSVLNRPLKPWRRRNLVTMSLWAVAVISLATLLGAVVALPRVLVESRHLQLTAKEQLNAEAELRSSLVQLTGGMLLVAGLFFTARGFRLTREGHITDRYTKAIEQLGSTNQDVRIGGIYALERIARDSAGDRETIVDVLATFVREHTKIAHRTPSAEKIGADVQAALYVLARRPGADLESRRLDFYHSGLNDADLESGDFRRAMFDYGRLDGASFAGASLEGADLSFCEARAAAFSHCSARGAHFVNAVYTHGWFLAADLRDSDFFGCDLRHSDFGCRYSEEGNPRLPPANLANARFTEAILSGTILRGVDLRTVRGLTPEQLSQAVTDSHTLPPLHWWAPEDDDDAEVTGDPHPFAKDV
jgi:hypothetical protein